MDDARLTELAERFGTPLYLTNLDEVRRRVARLRQAFPAAALRFAVKANPTGAVLTALAREQVGAEAISEGEIHRSARAGMPGDTILVGGPGQGPAMRQAAREVGATLISLDSPGQWRAWQREGSGEAAFLVRVNPGFDPGTHPHLATGAADAKFGVDPDTAADLAATIAAEGRLAGFHVHAGSMIDDPEVHAQTLQVLAPLFARFQEARTLNLGGGLAPDADPERFAAVVRPFTEERGLRLLLEPGRWLVADAGRLLTRVLWRKDGGTVHWICDAGMAQLLRPALYGAEHPIRVVRRPGAAVPPAVRGEVQGPLCENADRLGRDRELAAMEGDLLEVGRAGAYGIGMASHYASDLLPAEVAWDGGAARLTRERETVADLWVRERP